MHPGWLVLAVSVWIGFVCHVALWRAMGSSPSSTDLARVLLSGAFTTGACATVLSLLGWRRTLKPAATVLLILAAVSAWGIWAEALPLHRQLFDGGLPRLVVPPWPSLLRWQVAALLVTLGLLPLLWVWQTQLRRLPGPQQLAANATGMAMGVALLFATGWFLG